jgi:hypothetical protein
VRRRRARSARLAMASGAPERVALPRVIPEHRRMSAPSRLTSRKRRCHCPLVVAGLTFGSIANETVCRQCLATMRLRFAAVALGSAALLFTAVASAPAQGGLDVATAWRSTVRDPSLDAD